MSVNDICRWYNASADDLQVAATLMDVSYCEIIECPFSGLKPPLFKRLIMFESHAEHAQFEKGDFKSPLLQTYRLEPVVV